MEPLILQAAGEDAGKRLDAWLAEQTELTRSAAQKLLEEGRVTAGGKPLAKNTRLTGAETVSVLLPEPETVDIVPQDIPLDVVYEDIITGPLRLNQVLLNILSNAIQFTPTGAMVSIRIAQKPGAP